MRKMNYWLRLSLVILLVGIMSIVIGIKGCLWLRDKSDSGSSGVSIPVAVSSLSAVAVSSSQIDLTWINVSGEDGYELERSTDGISYALRATCPPLAGAPNTITYTDTALSASATYYYRVCAYNSAGKSPYSNEASATTSPATPPLTPPNAPSGLTATAVSSFQITLSWTDNSNNEDGFKIERGITNTSFTQITSVGANITSCSDTSLSGNTTYYYQVRAYNSAGNSAYSNEVSATTPVTPNTWTAITTTNAPSSGIVDVWTGTEMIVWDIWDGVIAVDDGGRYYPITDTWVPITTTNAPSWRTKTTDVWTGQEMIIWGGQKAPGGGCVNTGAKYNPFLDSWTAITLTNAPISRDWHSAVWTGQEMIIWGGGDGGSFNTGAKYYPITDTWITISTTNAPISRGKHSAIWTGQEMIIWGGGYNTGAKYYPITDTWVAITTTGAPSARWEQTAVWTGTEMLIWGGEGSSGWLNDGAKYNPTTDTWTPVSMINAPVPRSSGYATPGLPGWASVWTGTELLIWGGFVPGSNYTQVLNTGSRYNPATDTWTPITTNGALSGRGDPCAVWTGQEVIIWGGYNGTDYLQDGARYKP
mgnify:CR=1 FL=1